MREQHSDELILQGKAHVSWRKNQIKMGKVCNKTKVYRTWEFSQREGQNSDFPEDKNQNKKKNHSVMRWLFLLGQVLLVDI